MKITKYEHACFTVEKDGNYVVVDPGSFAASFVVPEHVVAVVITHEHGDHFDPEQVSAIIDKNPDALIIGPEGVVSQIEVFETKAVNGGDSVAVGGFDLAFYGEKHAAVHESMGHGHIDNVGVLINDLIYYPGDSLTVPDTDVTVLAVPTSGPWLKIGEAIDFLQAVAPRQAFPIHESIYSDQGQTMANRLLAQAGQKTETEYVVLQPGESLTV